ncbi:hypothetical protein QE152_g1761 [Popillia japonica]|uniref:Uncharacterized protein n=1 Tax=Popillia japonica TaxID=7064 RepID=A0AAW1N5D7_POPJA
MRNNRQRKEWFDKDCERELEYRRKLRLEMLKNECYETRSKYEHQRKKCKKLLREKKRKYMENEIKEMEENYKNKEVAKLYGGWKMERSGFQPKANMYKNQAGELLGGEQQILEMWKNHFEDLLNTTLVQYDENEGAEQNIKHPEEVVESEANPSTVLEIEEAIKNMRNNKSPGHDSVRAEMLKYGGVLAVEYWQLRT